MTQIFIQFFYLLSASIIAQRLLSVFLENYERTQFPELASFLNAVPNPALWVQVIALTALVYSLVCSLKSTRLNRSIFAVLFSLFVYTLFSHGKIHHTHHLWMFATLAMIFFNHKEKISSTRNKYVMDLVQSGILVTYFIAGLWKLRDLISLGSWEGLTQQVPNFLASSIAQGIGPVGFVRSWLETNPGFFTFAFFAAILFQLGSLFPIFISKYRTLWGWLAITFHLGTALSMGIWFTEQLILVFYFLIFTPQFSRNSKT